VCKFLVFEYVEFLAFWFLLSRNAVALVWTDNEHAGADYQRIDIKVHD